MSDDSYPDLKKERKKKLQITKLMLQLDNLSCITLKIKEGQQYKRINKHSLILIHHFRCSTGTNYVPINKQNSKVHMEIKFPFYTLILFEIFQMWI